MKTKKEEIENQVFGPMFWRVFGLSSIIRGIFIILLILIVMVLVMIKGGNFEFKNIILFLVRIVVAGVILIIGLIVYKKYTKKLKELGFKSPIQKISTYFKS